MSVKNRRGVWATAIVAVFIFVGICGGDGADTANVAAAPTTTPRSSATTRPAVTTTRQAATTSVAGASGGLSRDEMETVYVFYIREWSRDKPFNFIDELSDDSIVRLAEASCELWADGLTFEALALAMMGAVADQGWDALDETNVEAMGTLIGAGTEAICPQYSNRLP